MTTDDFLFTNIEPVEDALTNMDDLDIDADDLAEWLDGHLDSGFEELDLPTENSFFEDGLLVEPLPMMNCDIFEEEKPVFTPSRRRRASRSPPRRRSRQHSPTRDCQMKQRSRRVQQRTVTSSPFVENTTKNTSFSQSYNNVSQITSSQVTSQDSSSTLSSLAGLLSGKRTSLTAGLEQSRKQLHAYMSLMMTNQTL